MSIGLGSEGLWLCPTIDYAADGTAAATNFGSAGTFSFENGLTGSHWVTETTSGGRRVLSFASDRGVHAASNPVVGYPWAFSVWLYPTSLPAFTDSTFLSQASNSAYWWLDSDSGTNRLICYHGTALTMTGAAITLNAWNHVVVSLMNAGAFMAYINGTLAGSGTTSKLLDTTPQIGRRSDSAGDCFRGYIDDFRILPSVLSTREIAWLGRNRGIQGPVNWQPGVPN